MSQFGLIFDMDGLIFDTERILVHCWCQAAAEFGYSMQIQHALAVRSLTWCLAEAYLKRELGATFPYQAVRNRRRELVSAQLQANGLQVNSKQTRSGDFLSQASRPISLFYRNSWR